MTKKSSALFALAVVAAAPSLGLTVANAAEVKIDSELIVRFFEQELPGGDTKNGIPGYEYLQVDAGNLGSNGLSAHLYGWGRYDFGDFYDDASEGEILYGYVQYRAKESNFDAKLGRQYVFEGVSDVSIDGLKVGSDLTGFFTVSAYAGKPVVLETVEGTTGDKVFGGRVSHHYGGYYDIGVSYKRVEDDGEKQEELVGVDSSITALGPLSIYGRSVRNQEEKEWQEHYYEARLRLASLTLKPFYQKVMYDSFFDTGSRSSTPFTDPLGGIPAFDESGEEARIAGLEILWDVTSKTGLGAKYKQYEYEVRDDGARYYAVTGSQRFSGLTQFGAEAGRMQGDADEDQYSLGRIYGYYDQAPFFVSGEAVYAKYGEKIYGDLGDDRSIFVSLGGGTRLLSDSLALKLSGEYSKDPNFDKDVRGQFTVDYAFSK
ncbi:hypothetical protein EPN96_09360 [bacterium]|nr:MAG: hypothetical protein EPN96_09360 [bacterium]